MTGGTDRNDGRRSDEATVMAVAAEHEFRSSSHDWGGTHTNSASCSCGVEFGWYSRDDEYRLHVLVAVFKAGAADLEAADHEIERLRERSIGLRAAELAYDQAKAERDEARAQLAARDDRHQRELIQQRDAYERSLAAVVHRAEAAEAREASLRAAVEQIVADIDSECPPDDSGRSVWWDAMDAVRAELRKLLAAGSVSPRPDLATVAESMCDWRADFPGARLNEYGYEMTHRDYHFDNVCPYEAVAAVLRGQPDPRRRAGSVSPGEPPVTDNDWGHQHGAGQPCPIRGCWAASPGEPEPTEDHLRAAELAEVEREDFEAEQTEARMVRRFRGVPGSQKETGE